MNVYLDTSVVLRVLLNEPNPIDVWGKWDRAFSSALWRVEALRTVDRLRLTQDITDVEVADLVRDIQTLNETLAIYPVGERVLQRASETFPTVVGTLDAIHLASAVFIRETESIDFLLTHDNQLGTAARSLGFSVSGTN
jgi:predicted nucleic acid-binding protein